MNKSEYERLLIERKSIRSFKDVPISEEKIMRLLWAAQGTTRKGKRTVPSAGGKYPVFLYFVDSTGVHIYDTIENKIFNVGFIDIRSNIAESCARQKWIADAPVLFAIVVQYNIMLEKYRRSGDRYVLLEVGMSAQNLTIQAVNIGLGSCIVGAFNAKEVAKLMILPQERTPILIIPVGETYASGGIINA